MTTTDASPILRWEDPPAAITTSPGRPQDPNSATRRIARILMDHPGRWAAIRTGEIGAIRNMRGKYKSGAYPAFTPCDEWEFVSRITPGDRFTATLYGRYVGNPIREWAAEVLGSLEDAP